MQDEEIDDILFQEIGVSLGGWYLPAEIDNKYVAFCDILGFSNMVMSDFRGTLETYHMFIKSINTYGIGNDVETTIYSDSILIVGDELAKIVTAVQLLWFMALSHNYLIRGGIAYGKYYEQRTGKNLVVVSDALVQAVALEKEVKVPAVVLADDIEVPEEFWINRFKHSPLETGLLHFRDRNIVNPFNPLWLLSAANRVQMMLEANPQHKGKYLWFLALHDAVQNQKFLVPEAVLEKFLHEGVLAIRQPNIEQQSGDNVE